jgi:hypothetical protein
VDVITCKKKIGGKSRVSSLASVMVARSELSA